MSYDNGPEVARNYEAFRDVLPTLMLTDAGRHALLRDAGLVACFDTFGDACTAGRLLFADGRFSVQEVERPPIFMRYRG